MITLIDLVQLAYFMLPAYIANMMPVFGKNVFRVLAKPVDAGVMLESKRLFGSHKTWRGLFLGTVGGILTTFLQSTFTTGLELVNYADVWLMLGFTMGFGALLGDLIKSFWKRRLHIQDGARWIPFDQTDFVIGALALSSWMYWPGVLNTLLILIMTFAGHIIVNRIGYWLTLKQNPW